MSQSTDAGVLKREVGVFGAVMMGLGSIVGTGVFVSIGIGAGIAGPAVILAIGLAALVATCNGLSSAQLAANHPVSGGTYEYGYRYASPLLGFVAGWMFMCAKSASAATAALGLMGYLLYALNVQTSTWHVPLSLAVVVVLTVVVLVGIRQTNRVNIIIVSVTLFSLVLFVFLGLPTALSQSGDHLVPFWPVDVATGSWQVVLHATALMFVAYTGYGRIATLGEEVKQPRVTIPRAIIATLLFSMVLYMAVGTVGIASVGAEAFFNATTEKAAPLEIVARSFGVPGVSWVLMVGALTAMTGVLLNLILGLSRVLLAMGRRQDVPSVTAKLDQSQTTPYVAVIVVGFIIGGLVLVGNVKTTWTFSAFTVLIYYAITNFCALKLSDAERLYPRWISGAGLVFCLSLAFFVEPSVWMVGLGILLVGVVWYFIAQRLKVNNKK